MPVYIVWGTANFPIFVSLDFDARKQINDPAEKNQRGIPEVCNRHVTEIRGTDASIANLAFREDGDC
jgi:hypothetical protein